MGGELRSGVGLRRRGATLLLSLVLAGVSSVVLLARPIHAGISLTQERELGERFSLLARSQMPLVRDPSAGVFLAAVGRRLLERIGETHFAYRFFVVEDQSLNAFAVPGGFVYVNAGLIARVGSVSELAGVLAHEIAHVHMHHMARQYEKTQMVSYAALLGMLLGAVHPAIAAGAATVGATTQLKYRREFEQEADLLGSDYMVKAGFDPAAMVSFLTKVERQQQLNPAQLPPYLLSHPLTPDRIVQLTEKIRRAGKITEPAAEQLGVDLERAQALARAATEPQSKVIDSYRARAGQESLRAGAVHGLGLVYAAVGQVGKAKPLLAEAAAAGRRHARADLGVVLLRLGEVEAAKQELDKAVAEDPADPVAKLALARISMGKGKTNEAIRLLRAALLLYPELDDAEYALAECHGKLGEEKEQWRHLGEAFTLRGDFERAASALHKAYDLTEPGGTEREELENKIKLLAEASSEAEEEKRF